MGTGTVRESQSLSDRSSLQPPFEIGPTWNLYLAFCSLAALPALLTFFQAWQKQMPFDSSYRELLFPLLMLLYLRGRIVRLDGEKLIQGFPILGASMQYESIEGIHTEIRSGKGASTQVLVISKRDSRRRITIYIRSVDPTKLRQFVRLLKKKAPQIFIDDLVL
jgi:hypothetical protein